MLLQPLSNFGIKLLILYEFHYILYTISHVLWLMNNQNSSLGALNKCKYIIKKYENGLTKA